MNRFRAAIVACGLVLQPGGSGALHAQARAGAYDGNWNVILVCSTAADGARGYTFRFPAIISGSVLRGENSFPGTESWLRLEGAIQPDGSALLTAHGLTGNPGNSVGRVSALTPYGYHVRARFDARKGQGTRVELRPCTLSFEKV